MLAAGAALIASATGRGGVSQGAIAIPMQPEMGTAVAVMGEPPATPGDPTPAATQAPELPRHVMGKPASTSKPRADALMGKVQSGR